MYLEKVLRGVTASTAYTYLKKIDFNNFFLSILSGQGGHPLPGVP